MEKINLKCKGCNTLMKVAPSTDSVECPVCGETCFNAKNEPSEENQEIQKSPEIQVKLVCEFCKDLLIFDDENKFGENINCPSCNKEIYIPLPETFEEEKITTKPIISQRKEKKCPFCKEKILIDAVKCKHCGEFFKNDQQNENKSVFNKFGKFW